MRVIARAVGLFASLTFMQAMTGSAIATTGAEENVLRTENQAQSAEVESLTFNYLSLAQKVLLAAATAFDPKAAEDALIWYFYPVSVPLEEGDDAEWMMIGVRLEDGQYRIFHRDALLDMTTRSGAGADQVVASLENGQSLVLRATQRPGVDADQVVASLGKWVVLGLIGRIS